jgi:hypothetical protein
VDGTGLPAPLLDTTQRAETRGRRRAPRGDARWRLSSKL